MQSTHRKAQSGNKTHNLLSIRQQQSILLQTFDGMLAILPSPGAMFIANPQSSVGGDEPRSVTQSQRCTWELLIPAWPDASSPPLPGPHDAILQETLSRREVTDGELYEFRRSRSRYITSDTREVCDSKGSDVRIISWVIKISPPP